MSALVADQQRFLIEPVRIETIGGFQKRRDLLGEPCPDRLGLAAGRGFGLPGQSLDLVHALIEDLPERHAFATAHLDQMGQRLIERRRCGLLRRLVLGLVGFGLDDFDHALDAEQAIDARRHGIDFRGQRARDLHDRSQHVLVDTDRRDRVGALDGKIGVDRSARQQFAGALLGQRFELIPTRRQPQPQVKALGVDRLQFPFEGIGATGAMASGKTGHARQRHHVKLSDKGIQPDRGSRIRRERRDLKTNSAKVELRSGRVIAEPPAAWWSIAPRPAAEVRSPDARASSAQRASWLPSDCVSAGDAPAAAGGGASSAGSAVSFWICLSIVRSLATFFWC